MGPRMNPRPGMGPLGPSYGPNSGMRGPPPGQGMPPITMPGQGRPQWPPNSSAVGVVLVSVLSNSLYH